MRNQPRPRIDRNDFIAAVNLATLHARRAKVESCEPVKSALEHLGRIADLVNQRPDAWGIITGSDQGHSILISIAESLNLIVYNKKVKALLRNQ